MTNTYRVSAFTKDPSGGNPAGVVLDADHYTESQMLEIAKDLGYSETAFVMSSKIADYKVRFFTPVDEVDLCGHATIGTFNLMRDLGLVKKGGLTQETKAGVLGIEVYSDFVMMAQNPPIFSEIIPFVELAKCVDGIDVKDLLSSPIQVVSTGLRDIILPIKNRKAIQNLKPNFEAVKALSLKYDVTGIHAFTLDTTSHDHTAFARNFAPLYGIDEESATGTSNGALGSYIYKYLLNELRAFGKTKTDGLYMVMDQGHDMGRPSQIIVKLHVQAGAITQVLVGGSSVEL